MTARQPVQVPESDRFDCFDWKVHPAAERLVDELVAGALAASEPVRAWADRMAGATSTRLADWLDHVAGPVEPARLADAGFVAGYRTTPELWRHPGAQLPAVLPVVPGSGERRVLGVRVDDVAAFAAVSGSAAGVEGSPRSGFRRAVLAGAGGDRVELVGVERRSWACGLRTDDPLPAEQVFHRERAWRLLAERPRGGDGPGAVEQATELAGQAVELVGVDLAGAYFLELERGYWQRRNLAAVLQHARQDRFGLGWGNNDHHTFRSSRACFAALLRLLRVLGFAYRERFYAGAQAGWGAQVLEHPGNGGVIFADVDLAPGEVDLDFSAVPLPPGDRLGTVGLWCALHGESVLAAGMHHLEGQFDFDRLRTDLAERGVGQMAPFSDFPHLRQAFTEAERWPVPADRLAALVRAGQLSEQVAAEFARDGAAGSHLENLARRGGFKGFNQHNVSATMRATDPRSYRPAR